MTLKDQVNVYLHHLDFYKHFWQKKEELYIGLHTIAICNAIDNAIKKFDNGESSFLIITVPPRHGKSDLVSRFLPPHFIGTHPDCDVMLTTYSSSLTVQFSRTARSIVKTDDYKTIFKKELSFESSAVDSWKLNKYEGTVNASSLLAGITGKGYHLGILDDYCANRESAESITMRKKTWDSFTDDFMTRRAPVSITIILATQWHVDDVIGRLKQRNDSTSEKYDPLFPKFELISIPAENGSVEIEYNGKKETVNYDYLFTDHTLSDGTVLKGRFDDNYYKSQKAILGDYSYSALYLCNPQIRGGNLINTSKITTHQNVQDFPNIKYYRIWDLAHTQKQTQKDDPDWTSGTLLAYRKIDGDKWELWIKDVARIRANAPERDNFIRAVAERDGANVTIAVENSIESKDALNQMQYIFNGRRVVRAINCKGDKVSRMSYVEPIFDGGNVHILSGSWNLDWLNEVKEFPSGKHDDQVDNMSAGYELCCNGTGNVIVGGVVGW